MINDVILKEKYLNLQSNLYDIRIKLTSLIEDYDLLKSSVKNALLIDDKIVEEELFSLISKELGNVFTELTDNVIPSINNKI